ncbi:MAG TPA: hypothetical protein VFO83_15680, partial [Aggregicoccus sp.]|nr:hypothetical protein [Aggregicoccus sp.]
MPRASSTRLLLLLLCFGCTAQQQPWPWHCEEGVSCGSDHCVPDGPITFCLPPDVVSGEQEGPLQTEGPRELRVRAALPLEPRPLAPDVRVQGALPSNGRWTALYFAFDAVAGRQYRFTPECSSQGACLVLFLDAEGYVLVRPGGLERVLVSTTLSAPTTGRHYAVLSVDTRQAFQTYAALLQDLGQDDHGETLETATPLAGVSVDFQGRTEVVGDRDLFRLPVQEGERFHVDCAVSRLPIVLTAQGERLAPVGAPYVYLAGAPATLLSVEQANAGPYACQFRSLEHDDFADTAAQATPVTVPMQRRAWFEWDGDVDAFAFELQADRTYTVVCKSPALCTLRGLYPDGREEAARDVMTLRALQPGRTVVLVRGNNSPVADYTLNV